MSVVEANMFEHGEASGQANMFEPCVWHARTLRDLSFRAGVLDDDDDELVDSTARQARHDPLLNRPILVTHEGAFVMCKIVGVELGASSGRRYYRVMYPDGDLRHFNEVEAAILVEFDPALGGNGGNVEGETCTIEVASFGAPLGLVPVPSPASPTDTG